MNKETTCCFSGHRKIKKINIAIMTKRLKYEMEELIEQGVDTFISGGAVGFDLVAASMVIALKELSHSHIKLVFVLPCRDQDRFWKQREKDLYRELLREAVEVIYVSEKYHSGSMHERNRWMCDNSGYCICYLEKSEGGTAYTVTYAMKNGLKVINLAE